MTVLVTGASGYVGAALIPGAVFHFSAAYTSARHMQRPQIVVMWIFSAALAYVAASNLLGFAAVLLGAWVAR